MTPEMNYEDKEANPDSGGCGIKTKIDGGGQLHDLRKTELLLDLQSHEDSEKILGRESLAKFLDRN